MPNLQYKTRGNTSPQGKPRVYFCCHPEDFSTYFSSVSDDILAAQNCSVWYWEGAADEKEVCEPVLPYLEDLRQMQLFVVLITRKFLTTENSALNIELSFALENYIPVLPLMMEQGLEELFSHKCGALQFLDPNVRDITSESYEEKLKKYLDSVLIGDEMAEKIREAFDTYVFLSYRKKDRRYARELMHLIHRNDFCRDIAIWYDEFLVPGEDFNSSIREALQKSSLFVMAVTPNLINETNYIMTTEYPIARQEGKIILPAELVPTDREELSEKFEGIPDCADAYDEELLAQVLQNALQSIVLKSGKPSPEHDFFIGLAYLGGIDVEVNTKKALELITSAAEAGLLPAMDKLVEMYETGNGVSRSLETGILWREKKIAYLETAYHEAANAENLHALMCDLMKCGMAYSHMENKDEERRKYERSWEYAEHFPLKDTDQLIRRDMAVNCFHLGWDYYNEKDLEQTKFYLKKGVGLLLDLIDEKVEFAVGHEMALGLDMLGEIALSEKDYEEAKLRFRLGAQVSELFLPNDNENKIKKIASLSYWEVALTCLCENDLIEAKANAEKALQYAEECAEEENYAGDVEQLNTCINLLGVIDKADGNYAGAERYYRKARELWKEKVQTLPELTKLENMAMADKALFEVCLRQGKLWEAWRFWWNYSVWKYKRGKIKD